MQLQIELEQRNNQWAARLLADRQDTHMETRGHTAGEALREMGEQLDAIIQLAQAQASASSDGRGSEEGRRMLRQALRRGPETPETRY